LRRGTEERAAARRSTSSPDLSRHVICGTVLSFSPFAIGEPVAHTTPTPAATPTPTPTTPPTPTYTPTPTSTPTATYTPTATSTTTPTPTPTPTSTSTPTPTPYTFVGFLPPIANNGSSIFKSGSVVPTKFQLRLNGANVATATATIEVLYYTNAVLGTTEEITPDAAGQSNTDNLFRYDASTNQYVYDLKTTGYAKGTYLLRANVSDGTKHDVQISIK
jgi:hypothetical protein